MPVKEGYFDSKRDRAIIEAGGFFCLGCLVGKLAIEASPDPRYCRGCYEFLQKESGGSEKKDSGYWEEGGMVFVTGGTRWAVDKTTGRTISLGKAVKDAAGKPLDSELPPLPAPAILKAIEGGLEMKVGKYEIEADDLNISLFRHTKGGKARPLAYFSTLGGALQGLIDMGLRDTELKDMREINAKLTELQTFVGKLADGILPDAVQRAQNGAKTNRGSYSIRETE